MKQPTYVEALKMIWLLTWRGLVMGLVAGLVAGFATGFFGTLAGVPREHLEPIAQAIGLLAGFFLVYPYVFQALFRKQFRGFRLALIRG